MTHLLPFKKLIIKSMFIVSTFCLATSLHAKEMQYIDGIVATVDDQIILKSELEQQTLAKVQELQAKNVNIRDINAIRDQVLDSIILEKVQINRAKRLGLRVDPMQVSAQLEKIAQQNGLNLLDFQQRLNMNQPDAFDNLRDRIQTQMLIQKLREAEVISKATVTQNEIDQFIQRKTLSNQINEIKLQHILIAIPNSATPEQRQSSLNKITELKQRLQNGESFSELAAQYSDGPNALKGGELDWIDEQKAPSFFTQTLATLSLNQVSDIIQSPSGFHLIKLVDQRASLKQNPDSEYLYQLNRFIILDEQPDPNTIPQSLIEISQQLTSLEAFNRLPSQFADIPAEINRQTSLGWLKLSELPPALRNAVAAMPVNSALTPIPSEQGWTILFLSGKEQAGVQAQTSQQEAVQSIRMRKANEMFDLWLRRLKDEALIKINL
jgi:peptidyl-prolyl cis-trans isomerase SurA